MPERGVCNVGTNAYELSIGEILSGVREDCLQRDFVTEVANSKQAKEGDRVSPCSTVGAELHATIL